MKLLVGIILTISSLVIARFGPTKGTFTIDLDQAPVVRYKDIATNDTFRSNLAAFVNAAWINVKGNRDATTIERAFYNYLDNDKYQDRMAELQGLAYFLNVSYLAMFSVATTYERDAGFGCTAILARGEFGYTLLVHNLDYTDAQFLTSLYVSINVKKKGKILYTCSGIAGDIGAMLCEKETAFSIALNERWLFKNNEQMLRNLIAGKELIGWTIRRVLESSETYSDTLKTIEKVDIVSGAYISVGGGRKEIGEGAVVTRKTDEDHKNGDTVYMNRTNKYAFLVQCNCDRNNCGYEYDKLYRTSNATELMTNLANKLKPNGSSFTLNNIFDNVLKVWPILRVAEREKKIISEPESTISVVLMNASNDEIVSWIYYPYESVILTQGFCRQNQLGQPNQSSRYSNVVSAVDESNLGRSLRFAI